MGKKKPLFGVNTYIKRTPKKRPGRHKRNTLKEYQDENPIVAKAVSLESF